MQFLFSSSSIAGLRFSVKPEYSQCSFPYDVTPQCIVFPLSESNLLILLLYLSATPYLINYQFLILSAHIIKSYLKLRVTETTFNWLISILVPFFSAPYTVVRVIFYKMTVARIMFWGTTGLAKPLFRSILNLPNPVMALRTQIIDFLPLWLNHETQCAQEESISWASGSHVTLCNLQSGNFSPCQFRVSFA